MIPSASPLQTVAILGRVIGRRLLSRLISPEVGPDHAAFRDQMARAIDAAPDGFIAKSGYLYLDAKTPPWIDTGIDLRAGATVTTISIGRAYLNKLLDIYAAPEYALWARVGEHGEIINGTRDTNTFTTESGGRLYLATLTGEWRDKTGALETPVEAYAKASGGISVQIIVWTGNALRGLAALGDVNGLVVDEIDRLLHAKPRPEGWEFLWFLGRSEIYSDAITAKGERSIHCHTRKNVCILQQPAPFDLTPETRFEWTWKVDALPSKYAECTLPTHDYMSIALEFDNGQDLTYYWSRALPFETCYRCPLPAWNHRETHLVVRSGQRDLGRWLPESRNVYDDCRMAYGEAPRRIVQVWLIAVSLLQRLEGVCDYKEIRLTNGAKTLTIS